LIAVRPATLADSEWLLENFRAFVLELADPYFSMPDEAYARSFITNAINGHLVLVSEEGGKRTGFISGITTPHPYNPAMMVTASMFWWVIPERRRTRSALRLLQSFGMTGDLRGRATLVGIREGANVSERSMSRVGFQLHERVYRRMA
jgi:hypothetical protein